MKTPSCRREKRKGEGGEGNENVSALIVAIQNHHETHIGRVENSERERNVKRASLLKRREGRVKKGVTSSYARWEKRVRIMRDGYTQAASSITASSIENIFPSISLSLSLTL